MQKEVKKSWALFLGIGTMMIAHGLQMQIMGIRSVLEDFSVLTTGVFMSGYYVGYFIGSKTTPNLVSKSNAKTRSKPSCLTAVMRAFLRYLRSTIANGGGVCGIGRSRLEV